MTPRQAKLGVDAFTAFVVVTVAFALSSLTWRLMGEDGIGPSAAPVAPGRGTVSDIRPLIALAPFGTPLAAAAATGTDGAVKLKGIFLASPIEASIVLLATADGKVESYTIGSAVGGGVIESIEAEQILLRMPSGVQAIGFNPVAATTLATNAAATPAAAPQQVQPPAKPVAGAEAVRALIPPSAQGRQAPQPSPAASGPTSSAAPSGLRIGSAPPPELAAAGIRPGDIIQKVNGRTVQAGSNERELMAGAIAAGSARVEILRDGQRVSLSIPMR